MRAFFLPFLLVCGPAFAGPSPTPTTKVQASSMTHDFLECPDGLATVNDGTATTSCWTRTARNSSASLGTINCSEDVDGDGNVDASDNVSLEDAAEFTFTGLPTTASVIQVTLTIAEDLHAATSGSACSSDCEDWDGDGVDDTDLYPIAYVEQTVAYSRDGGATWTTVDTVGVETSEDVAEVLAYAPGWERMVTFQVAGGESELLVRTGYVAGIDYCERSTREDFHVVRVSSFGVTTLWATPQFTPRR